MNYDPDYTVTNTTDGGGIKLSNVEVILCFWGNFWTTNPRPAPSADDYSKAIAGILSGPYVSGLVQYGIQFGAITPNPTYIDFNTASNPFDLYTDQDVESMLITRFQHTSIPQPKAGHTRFYAVILPPGIRNSLTGDAGQHRSFNYNNIKTYYAWIDNDGSLTGHNCVTKVFSHELVETCSNPDGHGILVDGFKADGTLVRNDEIGDTCNGRYYTVNMNGIECSVQSYWSKIDDACILPTNQQSIVIPYKGPFGKTDPATVLRK